VVNLAGEPIAARRWNKIQKERIRQSRVQGTRNLINALALATQKPRVLISGSAVGYYGPRENGVVTETEGPGQDFLSGVCRDWEQEALRAEELGIRVVLLRTGLVLGSGGGALPRLLMPFRLFMGGPLGSGRQWMPWIHLQDMVNLILFLINNGKASGPFNAVAPKPVTNADFPGPGYGSPVPVPGAGSVAAAGPGRNGRRTAAQRPEGDSCQSTGTWLQIPLQ
jgi:hypothetical protein